MCQYNNRIEYLTEPLTVYKVVISNSELSQWGYWVSPFHRNVYWKVGTTVFARGWFADNDIETISGGVLHFYVDMNDTNINDIHVGVFNAPGLLFVVLKCTIPAGETVYFGVNDFGRETVCAKKCFVESIEKSFNVIGEEIEL